MGSNRHRRDKKTEPMDPLQLATEMISGGVSGNTELGVNIKFAFDDLGSVYVRGRGTAVTVSNDDGEADLEVRMPIEYFQAMMTGRVDPVRLMTSGAARFKGDVRIALQLGQLFSTGPPDRAAQ